MLPERPFLAQRRRSAFVCMRRIPSASGPIGNGAKGRNPKFQTERLPQCRTVNCPATVGRTLVEACSVADLARLEPLGATSGARAFRSPKAPSSFRRCRRCGPDRRAIGALATRRSSRVVLMNARRRHGARPALAIAASGQRLSNANRSKGSCTHCGDCGDPRSGGEPQGLEYIRKIRKIWRYPQANSQRSRFRAAWFRNS